MPVEDSGSRCYRESDYNSEGEFCMTTGDQQGMELASLRSWLDSVAGKLERLERDGCSHRADDLGRLERLNKSLDDLERVVNEWRIEVTKSMAAIRLWVAVGALSVLVGTTGWLITSLYEHLHK